MMMTQTKNIHICTVLALDAQEVPIKFFQYAKEATKQLNAF